MAEGYSVYYWDGYGVHLSPTPPVPPLFTDDQILDGELPIRADDFTFDLVDAAGLSLGTLAVSNDVTAPTIRFDTARTVFRTLSGVEVLRTDLQAIDTENERLRVGITLQNGSAFPLGTFMFGQDNQQPASWGNRLTPELFDQAFLLDQQLEKTISIPTGGSVRGLISTLLAPFSFDVRIDMPDQAAAAPLLFLAGTSRYDALKMAASLLGCFNPYLDNAGVLRFKAPRGAGDTQVDHTYLIGDGATRGRIFDESVMISNDSYRAPNRYIVTGADPSQPIVGVYDLPDSAPHSAVNRGGRVVTAPVRTVQGLSDPALAVALAYQDAITDRSSFSTVRFAAAADPRHDGFDIMNVLGVRYLETAWELELSVGGEHRHEGSALWVL